jgi:general nucleoside transport system ATP-binding protein
MELLAARGITKYFRDTGTLADDRVSLSLDEGETRAVVGENGAGKSTLARILSGLIAPDHGEILVRGGRIRAGSVREAETAGIGFVPQQSLLAGSLSVAESIALGREPRSMGLFVSRRKAYVESALLFERFGVRLDPDSRVFSLSAAERRQAEIARALARGGDILILDEPTSILSESESERLFELLARLTNAGKAVILITHRLSEVMRVADSVTVLRDGRVVADKRVEDTLEAELSGLMARRRPTESPEGPASARAEENGSGNEIAPSVFEMRGLRLAPGAEALSLAVKTGEIVAVTALAGNGLGRLEDYASGMLVPAEGEVLVGKRRIESIPRGELRSDLLAYMPSDREARGLCLAAAMRDNILVLRRSEFRFRDWIAGSARDGAARESASARGLAADPRAAVASLSGGNRQRLLLARELDRPRAVLVLAEPFQGLDLAAQAEASALIRELAARGSAVLLLVSKIEEMLDLAHRAIALYRGEIAFEGQNEGQATARKLLAAMTGASRGSAA